MGYGRFVTVGSLGAQDLGEVLRHTMKSEKWTAKDVLWEGVPRRFARDYDGNESVGLCVASRAQR